MGDKSRDSTPKKPPASSSPPTEKSATTTKPLRKTRTADAFLAAGGAAGSLALLQFAQNYLVVNKLMTKRINGGFLAGSAIKMFLNHNPPTLDAFWKSTAFSIVIGSSLHKFLWISSSGDDLAETILSYEYSGYLILFCMILFWKLEAGSIWGAGNSLAIHIAFQSGHWGQHATTNGDFQTLMGEFPVWYILSPYLFGHFYLYTCALLLAHVRRGARIYLLREEFFSTQRKSVKDMDEALTSRQKLRSLFDRIDTSGDGRLDATELKLAIRASVGVELSLQDCVYMIGSVDTDGGGNLDFDEFCESVDHLILH